MNFTPMRGRVLLLPIKETHTHSGIILAGDPLNKSSSERATVVALNPNDDLVMLKDVVLYNRLHSQEVKLGDTYYRETSLDELMGVME